MGKRIISQRRGRGTPRYKAPSHRYVARAEHTRLHDGELEGQIVDMVLCSGHTSPLIKVRYENGEEIATIAPAGVRVGDKVSSGTKEIKEGNIVALGDVPEGTNVFNIESQPGDGGKFVRSSGATAKVVAKRAGKVIVSLPSRRQKMFSPAVRATIGVAAGGGRVEKPFVKAGNKFYKMKANNKLWPRSEGVRMNAVDHPFGNSRSSNKGHPTIARKHAPAGAKVGKIRPRRTGKKVGKASRRL